MIDAKRPDRVAARRQQVLRARILLGVPRPEQHMIGRGQRVTRETRVVAPQVHGRGSSGCGTR